MEGQVINQVLKGNVLCDTWGLKIITTYLISIAFIKGICK